MRRGDLYRPPSPPEPIQTLPGVRGRRGVGCDPAEYTTVMCAGILQRHGSATQVPVSEAEGLKHASAVHCDGLLSLSKTALTDCMGSHRPPKARGTSCRPQDRS